MDIRKAYEIPFRRIDDIVPPVHGKGMANLGGGGRAFLFLDKLGCELTNTLQPGPGQQIAQPLEHVLIVVKAKA